MLANLQKYAFRNIMSFAISFSYEGLRTWESETKQYGNVLQYIGFRVAVIRLRAFIGKQCAFDR